MVTGASTDEITQFFVNFVVQEYTKNVDESLQEINAILRKDLDSLDIEHKGRID